MSSVPVDRKVLRLVLEATEDAATEALEVLEDARSSLVIAEGAVGRAQLASDLAASRAGYARSKLGKLLDGLEAAETGL